MTIKAHAPLQSHLGVTTYADSPDINGVHQVENTYVMTSDMSSKTFVDVEDIDVGQRTPSTLLVSGISGYDGTYLPVHSCSIGNFKNYPDISTQQVDIISREQEYPLFKKTDAEFFPINLEIYLEKWLSKINLLHTSSHDRCPYLYLYA